MAVGRVHVATVLGGPAGHTEQLVPQLLMLESLTHWVPQRWVPVGQLKSQTPF